VSQNFCGAQTAESIANGPSPGWLVPFDTELHAACDDKIVEYIDAVRKEKGAQSAETSNKIWNSWGGFPYRWERCHKLEELFCRGDPSLAAQAHTLMAEDCGRHDHQRADMAKFLAEECSAAKNLAAVSDPNPADCEKVNKLDDLIKRFETASQEEARRIAEEKNEIERERSTITERLLQQPSYPSFTTCTPHFVGGGFHCYSY